MTPIAQPDDRRLVVSAVTKFALSGLLVLVLVAVGGALALRSLGTQQAIDEARRVTEVTGHGIVAPALTPQVLDGDRAALQRLDEVIRTRVLDDRVVRLKLWTPDGRIIYSDEPRLIGRRFHLDAEEREAARLGTSAAYVANVDEPENLYERGKGKLLSVYLGVQTTDGRPVLFEEYLKYSSIAGSSSTIWRLFAPVLIAALLVLAALQVPLAWRMARRVRDAQRERERLLQRAIDASDDERRSIAGGLHDGVVQELAGLSFQMAAAVEQRPAENEVRRVLAESAAGTRNAIRQLRSLLLEIYPASLESQGLAAALPDLVSALTARGVKVDLRVPPDDGLPSATEQLVFRVAQEALRNVASHSAARHVAFVVERDARSVRLRVSDDGCGFDAAALERNRGDGHLGLSLMRDLAAHAGGQLDVQSAPGKGTRLFLEVPV